MAIESDDEGEMPVINKCGKIKWKKARVRQYPKDNKHPFLICRRGSYYEQRCVREGIIDLSLYKIVRGPGSKKLRTFSGLG